MTRLLVAISFLVISGGMVWLGTNNALGFGSNTNSGSTLINLGTEIFGILITIAVVEQFFDRKRQQDRAREVSWSLMHSLERAVWTWQGGPQRVGSEELLGIIAGIQSDHTITPSTRSLLVNIGAKARETMDKEPKVVKALPGLENALQDLVSLRSLQDDDSAVGVRMVAEILEGSVTGLANVLGLSTQRLPAALIRYRDARPESQNDRFNAFGRIAAIAGENDEDEERDRSSEGSSIL